MDTAFDRLDAGARVALEGAFEALRAEGLPCGAAIVDDAGALLARGRNHVYDPATGRETLEATPLAHAEMNALAESHRRPTCRVRPCGAHNSPAPCVLLRSRSVVWARLAT
ncbi:MAG: hypothetical protein WCE80_09785, partial [Acidimicrobiia bacterium]